MNQSPMINENVNRSHVQRIWTAEGKNNLSRLQPYAYHGYGMIYDMIQTIMTRKWSILLSNLRRGVVGHQQLKADWKRVVLSFDRKTPMDSAMYKLRMDNIHS